MQWGYTTPRCFVRYVGISFNVRILGFQGFLYPIAWTGSSKILYYVDAFSHLHAYVLYIKRGARLTKWLGCTLEIQLKQIHWMHNSRDTLTTPYSCDLILLPGKWCLSSEENDGRWMQWSWSCFRNSGNLEQSFIGLQVSPANSLLKWPKFSYVLWGYDGCSFLFFFLQNSL